MCCVYALDDRETAGEINFLMKEGEEYSKRRASIAYKEKSACFFLPRTFFLPLAPCTKAERDTAIA